MMKREMLTVEPVLNAAQANITALVKISLTYHEIGYLPAFYVTRQPAFLLVKTHGIEKILRITGEEVLMDTVKSECSSIMLDRKAGFVLQQGPGPES